jgi:hypothetical protein
MKDRSLKEQRWAEFLQKIPAERELPEFDPAWMESTERRVLDDYSLRRITRNGVGGSLIYTAVAAAIFSTLFSIAFYLYTGSNGKEEADQGVLKGVVVSLAGDSALIRNGESVPITIGRIVHTGDILQTFENGTVDVAFTGGILFRLKRKGRLTLSRLSIKDQSGRGILLALDSGALLNYIDRLSKGEEYSINTPTAIAGVRGTAFEIGVDRSSTMIQLIEGSIAVRPAGETEERSVTDRSQVKIEEGRLDVRPHAATPELIAEVQNLKEIQNLVDERSMLTISELDTLHTEAEIKQKYGKELEELRFKDGRTLRGVTVYQNAGGIVFQSVKGVHFVKIDELIDINYTESRFGTEN